MSTRRTTRAASRAGSTVASVVNTTPATPARRRQTATSNNPPPVALRPSTAYGTNTLPQASQTQAAPISAEVTSVLRDLLNPGTAKNAKPARSAVSSSAPRGSASRSRSQTPAAPTSHPGSSAQRSFLDESNIFGAAGIDSSVVSSHEVPQIPDAVEDRMRADRAQLESLARERLSTAHTTRGHKYPKVTAFLRNAWYWFKLVLPYIGYLFGVLVCLFFLLMLGSQIFRGRESGYVPSTDQSSFLPGDVRSIHGRLNTLEHDVKDIKKYFDLDKLSIDKLREMLPDELIVKKDKNGNIILSDDFWQALQNKIRSVEVDSGATANENGGLWTKYVGRNNATKSAYAHVKDQFPRLLEENEVATREEIIHFIHNIWDSKKDDISKEMRALKKQLDAASDSIKKFKHGSGGLSKAEIASLVEKTIRDIIPKAQLDALSKSNLDSAKLGMTVVNHFSKGTGATIDPLLTSPNYVMPENDVWWFTKVAKRLQQKPVPVPNAAEAALTPWQEYGDCWCTPSGDGPGSGPSLGVIMSSYIYPEQVVVEHILPSASLEPGATPRDMELWAFIDDPDKFAQLQALSASMFSGETNIGLPQGYLRIAEWTYDINSNNFVQAFEIGLDMKAVGVYTNKLFLRSTSNWGGSEVPYTCFYRIRVHGEVVPSFFLN